MLSKLISFYQKIRVYLLNTAWILVEKVFAMGLGLLVTVFFARFLGPEQFGILAYAISTVAIFGVAGHAGLSGLVVHELIKDPDSRHVILGTSFALKGIGYIVSFILVLIMASFTESFNSDEFWVLVIVALSLLFKPFYVIDFWFQSQLEARYTSISSIVATITSSFLKVILLSSGASLIVLAIAHLAETVLSVLLLIMFLLIKFKLSIRGWQFSKEKAKVLFKQGWVVILGSIFAVI